MTDQTPPPVPAAVTPVPPPSSAPAHPVADWYPDPMSPGVLRYWDGSAWTDHRAPAPAAAPVPAAATYASASQPVAPGAQHGHFGADGNYVIAGRRVCDPGERFGAYLLDGLLMLVTLYVGWLIWACFTAPYGQTPGKQIMKQRVYRLSDGQPASFGWMFGMRGLVAGTVFAASFYVLVGIVLAFMPLWDQKNQTFIDKLSSTVVVRDP